MAPPGSDFGSSVWFSCILCLKYQGMHCLFLVSLGYHSESNTICAGGVNISDFCNCIENEYFRHTSDLQPVLLTNCIFPEEYTTTTGRFTKFQM